jgi:hypothetical protein
MCARNSEIHGLASAATFLRLCVSPSRSRLRPQVDFLLHVCAQLGDPRTGVRGYVCRALRPLVTLWFIFSLAYGLLVSRIRIKVETHSRVHRVARKPRLFVRLLDFGVGQTLFSAAHMRGQTPHHRRKPLQIR